MRALAVEGLTKAYPRFTLDKVSLTLEQGRIMGLIGKNGAGKSTLLKSLLHLVSPDAGTITLLGRPFPEGELESRQELGVVLGGIDFYRHKRLDAITAGSTGAGTRRPAGGTWRPSSWMAASGWGSCPPGCG